MMKEKKKRIGLKESLSIFGKALKVSLKTKTAASVLVGLLGFPLAFLPALISIQLRDFTNLVQALFGSGTDGIAKVIVAFAILSALYIARLIFTTVRSYFAAFDTLRITQYLKEFVLRCTCTVKYKYLENYDDFKEKIQFVNTDAGPRVANSMQEILSWLQNLVTFGSILAVLLAVDVWLSVILCLTCIPAVVLAYFQKDEEYLNKTKWIYESNMAVSYFFEATWQQSMNDVRFFGLFPYIRKKYRGMIDKYILKKNKMTRRHVLFNAIADIFRSSVYIVILLIAAKKIFDEPAVGIGTFMLVFTMAGQLQDITAKIFIGAAQFVSDVSYMKDFFDLEKLEYVDMKPEETPRERFDLRFDNVSFTYPNTEAAVIRDLNLQIREGEKIAIVGENGSGKSTFIGLLTGVYEPTAGVITMGGEDIFKNLSKTHRTMSVAFQEFGHYEATIRENITVSDFLKQSDDETLRQLTKTTGAWAFIDGEKNKLDEVVGVFSETGNNLSGGQWQKIAITRCAYRDSARIMILDEPTAALDPVAEADLYRNFTKLTGDRTTILISHRLGITSLVDRILVFDEGRIVEDGDHKTLLAQDGLYTKMYKAQAQWYEQ
jgi:ABC-type multidrug transport system fused ATPase/permease subunit